MRKPAIAIVEMTGFFFMSVFGCAQLLGLLW